MSEKQIQRIIQDEPAMIEFGRKLASVLINGGVMYLHGELGTGKTTLVRGVLQGLGYTGKVKSPTFTLVEPYDVGDSKIFHFDLYRLIDAEELEFMGIRDYFSERAVLLVEWPERGQTLLPPADFDVDLEYRKSGRQLTLRSRNEKSDSSLNLLESSL